MQKDAVYEREIRIKCAINHFTIKNRHCNAGFLLFPSNLATAEADAAIGGIDDTELTGSYAVGFLIHLEEIAAIGTEGQDAGSQFGHMTDLKEHSE